MSAMTTVIGNATGDVELRFTQTGRAVGSVTVAVSDRVKNKETGQWEDGSTWFARCTIWGDLAEHAAATIKKGMRVIGYGRIGQREWEDREGNKRTSVEVTLDEIGPALRYATAEVTRTQGGSGTGAPIGGGQQRQQQAPAPSWANIPDTAGPGQFGGYDEEAPF